MLGSTRKYREYEYVTPGNNFGGGSHGRRSLSVRKRPTHLLAVSNNTTVLVSHPLRDRSDLADRHAS